jgi:hypothetical protein
MLIMTRTFYAMIFFEFVKNIYSTVTKSVAKFVKVQLS